MGWPPSRVGTITIFVQQLLLGKQFQYFIAFSSYLVKITRKDKGVIASNREQRSNEVNLIQLSLETKMKIIR